MTSPNAMETLQGWGGDDPDDLAAVCCAALRRAGVPYRVAFAFTDGRASAIRVLSGDRLVGVFPMHPIAINPILTFSLAAAIEVAGGLLQLSVPRDEGPGARQPAKGHAGAPMSRLDRVQLDLDAVAPQHDERSSGQALSAWRALCELLVERGVLVNGVVPPEAVVRMHEIVHAVGRRVRRCAGAAKSEKSSEG